MHRLKCYSIRKLRLVLILEVSCFMGIYHEKANIMNKLITDVNQLVEFGITQTLAI